jgi:hypothetical protein
MDEQAQQLIWQGSLGSSGIRWKRAPSIPSDNWLLKHQAAARASGVLPARPHAAAPRGHERVAAAQDAPAPSRGSFRALPGSCSSSHSRRSELQRAGAAGRERFRFRNDLQHGRKRCCFCLPRGQRPAAGCSFRSWRLAGLASCDAEGAGGGTIGWNFLRRRPVSSAGATARLAALAGGWAAAAAAAEVAKSAARAAAGTSPCTASVAGPGLSFRS